MGIDPKTVSQHLGHPSVSTTYDIYAHVIPELETEAVKKVAEKLLGKKPLLRYINKFHKFSWSPLYKTGFNPSIEEMFLNIKEKEFLEIICTKEMYAFFKKHSLHQIINNCFRDANVNYHKLWQLVFLSRWLKHWNN